MSNIAHAKTLGLAPFSDLRPRKDTLAVVGGGPSLTSHVEELRSWPGDIWAINGAWDWCRREGIASVFFTVDAHPMMSKFVDGTGVDVALLCSVVDPGVFAALKRSAARVYVFDIDEAAHTRIINGSCSATTTPTLALRMGYKHITYFGCEGSYFVGASHTYQNEPREDEMVIECGGELFRTAPDYYVQAQEIATYILTFPDVFAERSGGLLRALIDNKCEHKTKKVSKGLAAKLVRVPVDTGEKPYHFLNGAFLHPGEPDLATQTA